MITMIEQLLEAIAVLYARMYVCAYCGLTRNKDHCDQCMTQILK